MTNKQSLDEMRSELASIRQEIDDDRNQRLLRDGVYRHARHLRRLALEREVSAAEGVQYAEAEMLSISIGDEWHVSSGLGDAVLLSGDVGALKSSVLHFEGVVELTFRTSDVDLDHGSLVGRGLDVYGLFNVRNSQWKTEAIAAASRRSLHFDNSWWNGFEHFIVRGKGGELICLARSYKCREIHEPIESLRQRAGFWRTLQC